MCLGPAAYGHATATRIRRLSLLELIEAHDTRLPSGLPLASRKEQGRGCGRQDKHYEQRARQDSVLLSRLVRPFERRRSLRGGVQNHHRFRGSPTDPGSDAGQRGARRPRSVRRRRHLELGKVREDASEPRSQRSAPRGASDSRSLGDPSLRSSGRRGHGMRRSRLGPRAAPVGHNRAAEPVRCRGGRRQGGRRPLRDGDDCRPGLDGSRGHRARRRCSRLMRGLCAGLGPRRRSRSRRSGSRRPRCRDDGRQDRRRRLDGRRCGGGQRRLLCGRGRRRRHDSPGREERQRIDVPFGLVGAAHAQVDVRLSRYCVVALADRTDGVTFFDRRAALDLDFSELKQCDGVAVRGSNRDHTPAVRDRAGEADRPIRRSSHHGPDRAADVDPTVLAAGVRVAAQRERPQHRPIEGPRPRVRRGCGDKRNGDGCQHGSAHLHSLLSEQRTRETLARPPAVVNSGYRDSS
jgi:hypothetical protein